MECCRNEQIIHRFPKSILRACACVVGDDGVYKVTTSKSGTSFAGLFFCVYHLLSLSNW